MTEPHRPINLTSEEVEFARTYLAQRVRRAESGCLEWTLSVNNARDGRPIAWIGGRRWVASRLAWHVANGPIPAGLIVCHKCDNPLCVEAEHLFLGTHADNAHDRDAKGRQRSISGEVHHNATVPDAEVFATVRAVENGASLRSLSARLGVSRTTIRRWCKGEARTSRALPGEAAPEVHHERPQVPGQMDLLEVGT